MEKRTLRIDYLSRVEGETGVYAEISADRVKVELRVFEAPRFFESFLRGRPHQDIVDFTARICGICPVAYQMSAVHSIEKIFGIEIDGRIRQLRRLFYAAEWIESHSLHVYLLQGPDFYGAGSAWENRAYLPFAKRGLAFKKLGNSLMAMIGARPIHPVSVRVGGFYKTPRKKHLTALLSELERAYEQSLSAISWAAGLPFNSALSGDSAAWDFEYSSLRHPNEYPMNEGRVVSNKGLDESMDSFAGITKEYQTEYSNTLHSNIQRDGEKTSYLVGPLARINLNSGLLPSEIINAMKESGVAIPIKNVEMGIIARSVEIAYAFHEAIRIIKGYEEAGPDAACDFKTRSGTATWITEAPRGMLIHHYTLDDGGHVENCVIIPPTAQNAAHIERSLHNYLRRNAEKSLESLEKGCEKIIRSYDPCISCSVHLVKM